MSQHSPNGTCFKYHLKPVSKQRQPNRQQHRVLASSRVNGGQRLDLIECVIVPEWSPFVQKTGDNCLKDGPVGKGLESREAAQAGDALDTGPRGLAVSPQSGERSPPTALGHSSAQTMLAFWIF